MVSTDISRRLNDTSIGANTIGRNISTLPGSARLSICWRLYSGYIECDDLWRSLIAQFVATNYINICQHNWWRYSNVTRARSCLLIYRSLLNNPYTIICRVIVIFQRTCPIVGWHMWGMSCSVSLTNTHFYGCRALYNIAVLCSA